MLLVVAACSPTRVPPPTLSPAPTVSTRTPLIGGRCVVLPADVTLGRLWWRWPVPSGSSVREYRSTPCGVARRSSRHPPQLEPCSARRGQQGSRQRSMLSNSSYHLPSNRRPCHRARLPQRLQRRSSSTPRLVVQGISSIRPVGPYSYQFRWAAPDGSGGWSGSTESDTPSALASIRSAPPIHALVGTHMDFTLNVAPTGLELLAWQADDPVASPLGSASQQTVLNGVVVYEVRATWNDGPSVKAKPRTSCKLKATEAPFAALHPAARPH